MHLSPTCLGARWNTANCQLNGVYIKLLRYTSRVIRAVCICDACSEFLSNSISPYQFGFTKNSSSTQQLLLFYHQIFESLRSGTQTDIIFLDFAKAFDSVPHQELLFKLRRIGIGGSLWNWFSAYLTDRKQCVSIEGRCSTFLQVKSGVPQGSLLGPLLFLIYIYMTYNRLCGTRSYIYSLMIRNATARYYLLRTALYYRPTCKHWVIGAKNQKCAQMRICSGAPIESSYTMSGSGIPLKDTHRDVDLIRLLLAGPPRPYYFQSVQDVGSFKTHFPSGELCETQEAAVCFADLVTIYVLLPHLTSLLHRRH